MVTDSVRAEKVLADFKALGYSVHNLPRKLRILEHAFLAVRKEQDDLWRKKVVEIQKINADAGRQGLLEAEGAGER